MSEQPNNETPATAETAQAQLKNVPRVSKLIETQKSTLILMFFILLVGISIIMWAWQIGPFNTPIQQTDNSYIKGKTTVLSSQINGYIQDVLVSDFDHVKKGQILIRIDPTTYNQKVSQAQSSVEQAANNFNNQKQTIVQRQADIAAAQAKVAQIEAQYQLSLQQLHRYQALGDTGAVSKTDLDQSRANVANNQALLNEAKANVKVAEEALKTAKIATVGLQAQIKNAAAQLDQANTTKDYSIITAPMDGQLGEVSPRVGQYVGAGRHGQHQRPAAPRPARGRAGPIGPGGCTGPLCVAPDSACRPASGGGGGH